MSAQDDVKADVAAAYPRLTRPDVEKIVQLLAEAPAGHSGSSVAAALDPVFPEAADRLKSASDGQQTDYLRVLKGACTATLQLWKSPDDAKPDVARIQDFVDTVEGDT